MNRFSLVMIALSAVVSGCTAVASGGHHSAASAQHKSGMMMSNMDANRDGVISKQEFMAAHEAMFDRMKNKDGVIEAKKMEGCCGGMMGGMAGKGSGMMGHGKMEGGAMMDSCPMMRGQMPGKSS